MNLRRLCPCAVLVATVHQVLAFTPRPLDYQHPPEIHSELRYASVESPPPQSKPLLSSRQRTTRKPRKRGTTAAPTSIATVATTTKKSPTTSGVLSNNPARMNPTDSMPRSVVSDAVRKRRVEQLERQFQQSPILPTGLTTRQTVEVTTTQDFSTTSPKKRSSTGLTRDEEITYSYQIRSLRTVMRLRKQVSSSTSNNSINHGGDISEGSWAKACGTSVHELRKIIRDGRAAREAVVNANIGLVTSLAKKQYSALKQATAQGGGVGTILTLQDMIQDGILGLMEAAERFEPEKGFRFSTYATWWIRQRILRSISDTSRTIRLPVHVHTMLQKMNKAKWQIKKELGREPTTPELANRLDVSEEKLRMYTDSSRNVLSLENPLRSASSKEDTRTLGDVLASDAPTPEEDAEADYLRRDIRAVMDTALVASEREVIVARFGLDDGKPLSVEETARLLGTTRDRVRVVEARALNKLRHPHRNYRLKEYVCSEQLRELSCRNLGKNADEGHRPQQAADRTWFF